MNVSENVFPMTLPLVELCRRTTACLMRLNRKTYMSKKIKVPKISDKEAAELAEACNFAFGNDAADKFLHDALEIAEQIHKLREARDKRTRTECPATSKKL